MSASPTGDLSFSFEFKDGHIVAALPALDFTDFKPHPSEVKKTYYALVDSGSPITIGRQHGTLCFGEKEFDVAPHTTGMVNTTIDVLSELAGFGRLFCSHLIFGFGFFGSSSVLVATVFF
mmetsp:Transcript_28702/g.72163  ORF Transcript_28702/g.72163 Transcript_28702/m.72163 type:complete len:120 (+) Transcript_28702:116-475(+)